jgi:hypothetical protein
MSDQVIEVRVACLWMLIAKLPYFGIHIKDENFKHDLGVGNSEWS